MRYLLLSLGLLSCETKTGTGSPCNTLCKELVQTCGFAAFPTFSSCEEGCVYYQEEGVDIETHLSCIEEAECNEFAVIECENAFGVNNESE